MAESEEVLELRRRARRRLIGATALVLFLVIVPPWLMDLEPRPVTSNLSVEIPSKEAAPKLDPSTIPVPPPAAKSAEPEKAEQPRPPVAKVDQSTPPSGVPKSAGVASSKDAAKETPKVAAVKPEAASPAPKAPEPARPAAEKAAPVKTGKDDAERAAAALKGELYYIPLGAFNNRDNAKSIQQKVAATGLKAYVEVVEVKGEEQTRVRAGPFPNREAAEKARGRLKEAGLDPGPVRTR
jgi:DedD protein